MAVSAGEALAGARRRLGAAGVPHPGREARLLLADLLGLDEARLLARPEVELSPGDAARFEALLARRAAGEPAAYLLGRREFYGRDFAVDPRVLVPRPETEHLVEAALALELPEAPGILDVGTGSGCLAVTLALERAGARVTATDRSLGALAVARRNALVLGASALPTGATDAHGSPRPGARDGTSGRVPAGVQPTAAGVRFVAADLAAGLDVARFDLVVSNPPYIAEAEVASLPVDVREHEPHEALVAGPTGLEAYARLASRLGALRPGTPLLLEVGAGQAAAVVALLDGAGFVHERTVPDYAGIPRVVIGRRAPWTASTS